MAGRGPAPGQGAKPTDQRRRRNAPPQLKVIESDGKEYGPPLPDTHDWPPATVAWWQTWRTSAQGKTFTDTDWSFLLDTAVLHADFWLGDRSVKAELRLRVAKFGATPEDRARLKISVGTPGAPTAATPPTRLQSKGSKDRRARLLKAVGDDDTADDDGADDT